MNSVLNITETSTNITETSTDVVNSISTEQVDLIIKHLETLNSMFYIFLFLFIGIFIFYLFYKFLKTFV